VLRHPEQIGMKRVEAFDLRLEQIPRTAPREIFVRLAGKMLVFDPPGVERG
jgi:hypothetical protein